jgi:hypothetical protein
MRVAGNAYVMGDEGDRPAQVPARSGVLVFDTLYYGRDVKSL